jgi:hypothetical protein
MINVDTITVGSSERGGERENRELGRKKELGSLHD